MATQWEYVIVGESYLTAERLAELGDGGWEAIGVVRAGSGAEELSGVLFKRRREPNNAALAATDAEPVPPDDPLLAPDALLEACEEAEQIMAGYVARIDKGWLVSGTYEQCKAWLARRAAMAASDARPAQTREEYEEMRQSIACGAWMVLSGACPGMCGDDYCPHIATAELRGECGREYRQCWEEFCAAELAKSTEGNPMTKTPATASGSGEQCA